MPSDTISVERKLLKSKAFRTLPRTAIVVLLDFLMKKRVQKTKASPGRDAGWRIVNNGEIEYCYSTAEKKGITRASFMRAINILVERGFIDIAHSGHGGKKGDKSLYAISERWEDWETAKFIHQTRPKDKRKGCGFAAYWSKKKA